MAVDRHYTLREAAERTGMLVKRLRSAIQRGWLKASRPGLGKRAHFYVTEYELNQWLESLEVELKHEAWPRKRA